ncbi:putative UDP-sugar transporter protein SLC35A5 [Intoshia linei]|uniref:Putative UDP-sugar transporter protein SLC35A5 n=1 Tax=Intoshia linei TaxID=1819745 RepID=A0A177BBC5_9BILA|nr:putative UDP-sugar transporter protein SLC35A5 [Intoshia linei]
MSNFRMQEKNHQSVQQRPMLIKYTCLFLLTLQNCCLILMMAYSRQRYDVSTGKLYFVSTAVVFAELVKIITSIIIVVVQQIRASENIFSHFYQELFTDYVDFVKISVPGVIYMIQNNLSYIAISNLDATTFQVSYQLKILTTGLFSVILLGKKLTIRQWISLFLLFVGISLVQLDNPTIQNSIDSIDTEKSKFVGISMVGIVCLTSGFAGVYFEKVLKGSNKTLWIRNIQMSAVGLISGVFLMMYRDYENIQLFGILHGYDFIVYTIIFLQAFGGLLVACVVKYADNILKGFSTSISIILSCLFSLYIFNYIFGYIFICGVGIVSYSVYMYARYAAV